MDHQSQDYLEQTKQTDEKIIKSFVLEDKKVHHC